MYLYLFIDHNEYIDFVVSWNVPFTKSEAFYSVQSLTYRKFPFSEGCFPIFIAAFICWEDTCNTVGHANRSCEQSSIIIKTELLPLYIIILCSRNVVFKQAYSLEVPRLFFA